MLPNRIISPVAKSEVKVVLDPVTVLVLAVTVIVPVASVNPMLLAPTSFHQVKLPAVPSPPVWKVVSVFWSSALHGSEALALVSNTE